MAPLSQRRIKLTNEGCRTCRFKGFTKEDREYESQSKKIHKKTRKSSRDSRESKESYSNTTPKSVEANLNNFTGCSKIRSLE